MSLTHVAAPWSSRVRTARPRRRQTEVGGSVLTHLIPKTLSGPARAGRPRDHVTRSTTGTGPPTSILHVNDIQKHVKHGGFVLKSLIPGAEGQNCLPSEETTRNVGTLLKEQPARQDGPVEDITLFDVF